MGKRLIIPGADFSANAIEQEPIPVPVEYTLQNGFASGPADRYVIIDNDESANLIRVRTNQLYGSYTVKTKTGYEIRSILTYADPIEITGPGFYYPSDISSEDVQGRSEYTFVGDNRYSIITFCKTDATQPISASEDIVDYIIRPLE